MQHTGHSWLQEPVVITSHHLPQESNGEHSAFKATMGKDEEWSCLSMQKSRADVTEGAESIFSCPEKHGRVIVTVKWKVHLLGMITRAMTL